MRSKTSSQGKRRPALDLRLRVRADPRFGFSLRSGDQLQFAGDHLVLALLGFKVASRSANSQCCSCGAGAQPPVPHVVAERLGSYTVGASSPYGVALDARPRCGARQVSRSRPRPALSRGALMRGAMAVASSSPLGVARQRFCAASLQGEGWIGFDDTRRSPRRRRGSGGDGFYLTRIGDCQAATDVQPSIAKGRIYR